MLWPSPSWLDAQPVVYKHCFRLLSQVLTSSSTGKTETSPGTDELRKTSLTRGSLPSQGPASPANKLMREPTDKQSVSWFGRHVLTVTQFSRDELHMIFNLAYEMRQMVSRMGQYNILSGKILANLFYEPSTRTSCSFEAAMSRLGGQTMTVREMSSTSAAKGATLLLIVQLFFARYEGCFAAHLLLRLLVCCNR